MVLVDVHFSNGTVRLDLSQAAIDFYRAQGVRVELVTTSPPPPTEPICEGVRMNFEGTPSFQNGRLQVILNAVPIGICKRNIGFTMQLKSTGTGQVLQIVKTTLDFTGSANKIIVLQANVNEATINGEIFAVDPSTGFTLGKSNKLTFQVQEGITPPPPPPPPPILAPNIFDKGIVALLAVAALMPRGKKR